MEATMPRSNGLQLVLEVLSRRKWLAILTFGAVFTGAVSASKFLPDMYQSSATVLIERQQIPEAFVQSPATSAVETRLQALSEEILSRSRLEELITRYDLYTAARQRVPLQEVVEQARRDIKVDVKRVEQMGPHHRAVSFNVSYSGLDPHKVALVTNAIASLYVEQNTRSRERQAIETAQFLASELEEVKKELDEQEQRLSKAREREANLALLAQMNTQLRQNNDSLTRVSERRAALAKQLGEAERQAGRETVVAADGRPVGGAAQLEQRIAELTQRLAELETRFTPKYPDVVKAKKELASLIEHRSNPQGNAGRDRAVSLPASQYMNELRRAIGEAEAEIRALRSEADGLRHSIAGYRHRLETTPQPAQQSQTLEREYEATRERYNSLLKRQEEARLGESMEQSQKGEQLRIINPAVASSRPAAPDRRRLTLMGFMLSLGLAAGVVVLVEQWDTSFHRVDDLRAFTRVPVLVSISRIVTTADVRRRQKRFSLAVTSAILSLLLIAGLSYLLVNGNEQVMRFLVRRGL
jgi:polysaccharide chain length determinant protein (PEP-CTERM system associated)